MDNIKQGEIVILSSGCYSDYSIYGLFVAKNDIDTGELRNTWINLHPEQTDKYSFEESQFIDWIKELDLLEPISSKEWFMSAYSNISEMRCNAGPMSFT